MLKNMLINIRWGNALTEDDRVVVKAMTLFELLGTAFITPKTFVTKDLVRKEQRELNRKAENLRQQNQQMNEMNSNSDQLPVNSVF